MCNGFILSWAFLVVYLFFTFASCFKLSNGVGRLGTCEAFGYHGDKLKIRLGSFFDDGSEPTEEEISESKQFLAHIYSNPIYDEREPPKAEKIPVNVKNHGVLKNLGRKSHQDILDDIRNEMDTRVKKEEMQDDERFANLPDGHSLEFQRESINADELLSRFANAKFTWDAKSNFETQRTFKSQDLPHGMRYRKLGESDLIVSEMGMGTCMFDNPELIDFDHAVEIMQVAHKRYGINFYDTCEYDPYPYEPRSFLEGHHRTLKEFLKRVDRKNVIISGRISSNNLGVHKTSGRFLSWVRDDILAEPNLKTIQGAVDGLLQSLGTDYLDILSFVYPYRYVPLGHLGEDTYCWSREWKFANAPKAPELSGDDEEYLSRTCEILNELFALGKIRAVGLSNDTLWGMFQMKHKLNRKFKLACSQHLYNLLHRNEVESSGLSEACLTENLNCPIVAYGALAGGILTGKYIDPQRHNPMGPDKVHEPASLNDLKAPRMCEIPEDYGHLNFGPSNGRCNIYPDTYHTHRTVWCQHATAEYLKVARTHGMTLSHLSLLWVLSRPFIASTIIGPRTIGQLHDTVSVLNQRVTRDLEQDIHEIFLRYRAPTMGGPQRLTRLDEEMDSSLSQNELLKQGALPIWSGGSHWDMDNIPSLEKIDALESHAEEYIDVKRIFGLLDKPNDDNWPNYRCWVERINEMLPGEYFAVKESRLFGWDKMKLDEFTVVPKTSQEVARDDTSDFHFYWRGGKVYVGKTTKAIEDFYNDKQAVFNVMKERERSILSSQGRKEPVSPTIACNKIQYDGEQMWSMFDADLIFKRLLKNHEIDTLNESELYKILYQCGLDEVKLSIEEEKCAIFAHAKRQKPDFLAPLNQEEMAIRDSNEES
ncbi:bifunctional NADP-dependent oxidoreductase domain superfamily/NADP-dependent oxidoreductase domain [Babesia duncani]|uniref:Bifunctional NADP-dependent oxidoreductase domain superfamily/NADP-dependent oxidoreductase domain n=1 Tax=Babesia duncani TaxID=323732 RepID=A0AAD9PND8_9APIC|nr:bifunctional NADP-dependent oxidoreductase domain superfamily/NADP-dependent oxidoreductase domain [Babesia duncani]